MRQATLLVPEGWVIDDVVRERLACQLDRAQADVVAVVAETGELPPGASYRVHSERLACAPLSVATERRPAGVRGVALVRPGVDVQIGGDTVEVNGRLVLVDPGAHAHDPGRPPGELTAASPLGRPPFPRRPIVVFSTYERDLELLDWARELVNGLLSNDIEARLAAPIPVAGRHLTRPCLPAVESIDVLAPDIVVALDAAAGDIAKASRANRSLVVIELGGVEEGFEIVPWQRQQGDTRVRARIGRRIDADSFARLVFRLSAGPHPLVASDVVDLAAGTWTPGIETRARRWSPTSSRTITIVSRDEPLSPRSAGLAEHLAACGVTVEVTSILEVEQRSTADLVLLDTSVRSEAAAELATSRRAAGRPTVVDLGLVDLVAGAGSEASMPSLAPVAARIASTAGAAMSAVPAVHTAARRVGARALFVPTLLTRARAGDLRRMRGHSERWSQPVVAWNVGAGERGGEDLAAVGAALHELLIERPELRVVMLGDRDRVSDQLLGHSRIDHSVDTGPEDLAAWTVQLWTPAFRADEIADDLVALVEASCAGAPSVFSERVRPFIEGPVARDLVVDPERDPSAWLRPLRLLLDQRSLWDRRSGEAIRRADALYEAATSVAVANRILGWARFEVES